MRLSLVVVVSSRLTLSSKEELHSLLNLSSPLSPKSRFGRPLLCNFLLRLWKFSSLTVYNDVLAWESEDRPSWIRDDDFYACC